MEIKRGSRACDVSSTAIVAASVATAVMLHACMWSIIRALPPLVRDTIGGGRASRPAQARPPVGAVF